MSNFTNFLPNMNNRVEDQQILNSNAVLYSIMSNGITEYDLIGAKWNCIHVILVIQLIRSSGVKAVKGLCAPFAITKFIVSVYLNSTNSNVQTNYKIELFSPLLHSSAYGFLLALVPLNVRI